MDDVILLFTLERTLDAVADGEIAALGIGVHQVVARLGAVVRTALERSHKNGRSLRRPPREILRANGPTNAAARNRQD